MHDISGTLCQNFMQIGPHGSEISFLIWEIFLLFFDYRNFEAF